jgi:chitinase
MTATRRDLEGFFLNLDTPLHADLATGTGTVTIGASDTPDSTDPDIRAPADLIIGEAEGFIDLPVTLSAPSLNPVSVEYSTLNSTAAAGVCGNGGDYVNSTGTLNFAPGETTKVVRVQVVDCTPVEPFEAFTFGLDTEHNGVISRASSRISIVDNDTIVPTPKLFVRDAVVDEKDGNALVSVLLGGPTGQASNSTVTVHYATANGSATGSDYTSRSGTLSFAPGETVKTVAVPIADDGSDEPAESFTLVLDTPIHATIARGTGTVTIGASDATAVSQPGISAPFDVAVGEGDGFVDLTVRLSAPGQSTVSISYATHNVTAFAGVCGNGGDYVAASGRLNFAPGETTKVVSRGDRRLPRCREFRDVHVRSECGERRHDHGCHRG